MSFGVYVDDNQLDGFSNLQGTQTINVGKSVEGVHRFRFENINGYLAPGLGAIACSKSLWTAL